jgi:hypothetical protein
MTLVISVVDPKYYTEPVVRSRDYEYEVNGDIGPYPCEAVEEIVRPKGEIPHHLPGQNPFLTEYAKAHGIPTEAARGGAETMYPEYRKKIKDRFVRPEKCTQNCGAPPPAPPPPPPAR